MSMNQSGIQAFLNRSRSAVLVNTGYHNVFGRTPAKVAKMLRDDPDLITGGVGLMGTKLKQRAHASALRKLVRNKMVSLKVAHDPERGPIIIMTKRSSASVDLEQPRKKRKYRRRTPEEIAADKSRVRRKYTRRNHNGHPIVAPTPAPAPVEAPAPIQHAPEQVATVPTVTAEQAPAPVHQPPVDQTPAAE